MYAVAVGGSTIYIGGVFSLVGGSSRSGLASLSSGGTLNGWNPSPNAASVFAIAVGSGAPAPIYVGGSFTAIGGQNRAALASIDSFSGNANRLEPGTAGGRQLGLPPGRAG